MIEPKQLDTLLHPQFDAAALKAADANRQGLWPLLRALPAVKIVFTAEDAEGMVEDEAKKVVLVRLETSPRTSRA